MGHPVNSITVSGLKKTYGDVRAVDGISFTVGSGEVFGLLGPNGAGKSTTVEIMAGLRKRDGGRVSVLGLDPGRQAMALKPRIGMQMQSASLYPRLTVHEILRLFASFYPAPIAIEDVLDRVELADKARALTSQLSGGQIQRLSIAVAMIGDGELVFLDEPTTGLDPQARRRVWSVVGDLQKSGKTVVLTTHYMEEAELLCDRVAVVDRGRIIALGSPRSLIGENFSERAVEFSSGSVGGLDLETVRGVSRIEHGDDRTTLYTSQVGLTVESLMSLVDGGIDDLTVRQATLEDVFLKLTGRRIRE